MALSLTAPHVLTVGAAVRDVFLTSPAFTVLKSAQFSTGFGECVALGSKVDVTSCTLATGGGASNASVTFARLGFAPSILAKIGNDEPGKSILAELAHEGVNTKLVKISPKKQTGYSTLLTTADGERTALVFRGASADWTIADIPPLQKTLGAVYITSLGGNMDVLKKVIERAHAQGAVIALNPGAGELARAHELFPLLAHVTVLILNKEEARILTSTPKADALLLAAKLHSSVPFVVLTDGAQGSYVHTPHMLYVAQTSSGVKSVSRTGAGDAFGSAFFASHLSKKTPQECLQIATLNAESVIQHVGAKTGILSAWPKPQTCARVRVTPARR